jgi:hypothetical protein
MKNNTPNNVVNRCDWHTVIAESEKKDCLSYRTRLSKCARQADKQGDVEAAELLRLLGTVTSFVLDPNCLDQPYGQFWVDVKGRSGLPEDLTNDELTTLKELIPEVSDPELRARITDVLWLRERDHHMAECAIESYLESSRRLAKMEAWHDFSNNVKRATRLAHSLNNPKLLSKCIAFIEFFLAGVDVEAGVPAASLMKLLQELQQGDPAKYALLAGQMALKAEKQNDWSSAQLYWTIKAKWHAKEKNEEKEREARVFAAKTFERASEDALTSGQSPRYIAAAAHLRKAIEAYRQIGGMQDYVKLLHVKLLDYERHVAKEMGTISTSEDITYLVNDAIEVVKGRPLPQALLSLAFIVDPPKVRDLEKLAQQTMKKSLKYLVNEKRVDQDGKVTANRPAINPNEQKAPEEALRSAMMERANMYRHRVADAYIEPARKQINEEHRIGAEKLLPLVVDNPFVEHGREKIFAVGLHAGFTGDFLVAAHLLIPQLENSLRYLLIQQGIITSMLNDELIQDEYPLTKIISLSESKEVLGEDVAFDLQGVLVDRFGFNLRNRLAHGMINFDEFFLSSEASYLWWITLRLCCKFKEEQEREKSS